MKAWNKLDFLLAAAAGFVVFGIYSLFPVDEFTPELNGLVASVHGLRPPESLYPVLWCRLAALLPPDPAWFGLLGRLCAGLSAALASLALRGGIRMLVRPSSRTDGRFRRLVPWLCAALSAAAVTAAALWRAFALFSPSALSVTAVLLFAVLFERWVFRGGWLMACAGLFLFGLAVAETPFFLLYAALLACWFACLRRAARAKRVRLRDDFPRFLELPFWRLFFSLLAGVAAGGLATYRYARGNGLAELLGWRQAYLVFHVADAYLGQFTEATTAIGWTLSVGLCLAPFLLTVRCFSAAFDEGGRMPFASGLVLLVCGAVGYLEQGPFMLFRFWTWTGGEYGRNGSSVFLASSSLLGSFEMTLSLTVVVSWAFRAGSGRLAGRVMVLAVAVLMLGSSARTFPHARMRRLLAFNAEAVRETVREAKGLTRVFTDGSMDAALELEAYRRGSPLVAVDMLSSEGVRGLRLRRRGLADAQDLAAAEVGSAVFFRRRASMAGGLDDSGMQLGREFWQRDPALKRPWVGALLARMSPPADGADGADAAAARLADAALAVADCAWHDDVPAPVEEAFHAVLWRLSRMARWRGDHALADRLDRRNGSLSRQLRDVEEERMRLFMQLTPTEGLSLALARADFAEGVRYATQVLKGNPEDPRAHFATGMYYLTAGDDALAERHLRMVLQILGEEPASLNNLSVLCRRAGRYAEAVDFARRARAVLPGNPEVERTLTEALSKSGGL